MRKEKMINDNWLFSKTCKEVPGTLPSGEGWEPVTVPHTWNAVDGMVGVPFERGAYWYVRNVTPLQQPRDGGRLYIEVGAAGLAGEIYVNGQFAVRHVGGYSAFRADVTDLVRDGENTLAILCDNRYSDKVYPQRADFTFYGGLYRYVSLVSVPESHFTLDEFGGPGVYIDTEEVPGGAFVTARTKVCGLKEGQKIALSVMSSEFAYMDGEPITEAYAPAEEETALRAFIPDVRRWDPETDWQLYTAKLSLIEHNEVIDEIETDFGVRDFEIDRERGFILNGRDYPLRGVCRHQDRLYEGNALPDDAAYEDASLISEMGANTVRLAHYQQAQAKAFALLLLQKMQKQLRHKRLVLIS